MVEKYVLFLIDFLSNLDSFDKNKVLEVMPWSKLLPDDLKIPIKNISEN